MTRQSCQDNCSAKASKSPKFITAEDVSLYNMLKQPSVHAEAESKIPVDHALMHCAASLSPVTHSGVPHAVLHTESRRSSLLNLGHAEQSRDPNIRLTHDNRDRNNRLKHERQAPSQDHEQWLPTGVHRQPQACDRLKPVSLAQQRRGRHCYLQRQPGFHRHAGRQLPLGLMPCLRSYIYNVWRSTVNDTAWR